MEAFVCSPQGKIRIDCQRSVGCRDPQQRASGHHEVRAGVCRAARRNPRGDGAPGAGRAGRSLAADESVVTPRTRCVAGLEAADIVVLKVQPSAARSARSRWRRERGCRSSSSALETLRWAGRRDRWRPPCPSSPCLRPRHLLALSHDVTAEPLLPVNGHITVRRPEVDEDLWPRPPSPRSRDLLARLEAAADVAGVTL